MSLDPARLDRVLALCDELAEAGVPPELVERIRSFARGRWAS